MPVIVSFVGAGSGQTNGLAVSITSTSTPGQTIHTYSGTGLDLVNVWAQNNSALDVLLTVEWGNATASNNIQVTIKAQSGPILVASRRGISTGTIKAFAATTAVIACWAEVWNSV